MDLSTGAIQALLFAIFAAGTAALAAVIGPTYDNLLVPELSADSLYPSLSAGGGGGILASAARFSSYLLTGIVDPAIALAVLGVGALYLVRAFLGTYRPQLTALLPRLVVAVLVSNLTLPISGGILGLASVVYPYVAGFDGGAWQHWQNLGGWGLVQFSWDNGILAFIVAFFLFSLVLLLAAAVAIRDALLGVLLVLLPIFTLMWPVPWFSSLARRSWLWFIELAFLPCVLVIPLELAVGSTSILLLMGYLVVSLASPSLLSMAGSSLTNAGFPSAGGAVVGGIQRGLLAASDLMEGTVRPILPELRQAGVSGRVTGALQRSAGRPGPLALPAFTSELLGHGAARLFRHVTDSLGVTAAQRNGAQGAGSGRSAASWGASAVRGRR
jgi:hypothetical protein